MKIIGLFIVGVVSAWGQAAVFRTVCASGCTYTSLQTAVTTTATDRASTCVPYVIAVNPAITTTELDIPAGGTCTQYITVRSSRADELPRDRVSPGHASLMPLIQSGANGWALRYSTVASGGAQYWLFDGLQAQAATGTTNYFAIYGETDTGNGTVVIRNRLASASNITFRRMLISSASAEQFMQGGFRMAGREITVEDSYVSGPLGIEVQGVGSCECETCTIRNNYLSAPGENVLWGGCAAGGTHNSTVAGWSFHGLKVLGNTMRWTADWKVNGTAVAFAALPVPCYPGEYARTTTSGGAWAKCNTGGTGWTDSVPAAPGQTLRDSGGIATKVLGLDIKAGRSILMRGNAMKYGWYQAQQGQCLMMNSSPQDQVRDIVIEYNDCSETVTLVGHGISEVWNPTVRHNIAWNLSRANTGGGSTARYAIGLNIATNTRIENNSIFYASNSEGGSWLQVSDTRPTNGSNGGKGAIVFQGNIFGGSGSTMYSLLGSSWGWPGSWCRLIDTQPAGVSGWIMPGASLAYGGQVYGGPTLANTGGQTLTGATCDYNGGVSPIWPAGTLLTGAASNVYTSPTTGDLSLLSGAWQAAGVDGKDLGANIAGVAAMTAGGRNPYLDFAIQGVRQTASGTATVEFVPVRGQSCTLTVSSSRSFSSTAGTVTYPSAGRAQVTGLSAGGYWTRIACGAVYQDSFLLIS